MKDVYMSNLRLTIQEMPCETHADFLLPKLDKALQLLSLHVPEEVFRTIMMNYHYPMGTIRTALQSEGVVLPEVTVVK